MIDEFLIHFLSVVVGLVRSYKGLASIRRDVTLKDGIDVLLLLIKQLLIFSCCRGVRLIEYLYDILCASLIDE
jgi:NhaP-type Na+/H+ and K+/H+ antiporter